MAAAGADVGVNYPSGKEDAERVVREIIASGGQAMVLQADVSREDQVVAMFQTLIARYGTIDILVSNAGIQKDAAFVDMTLDQWNAVLGGTLTGGFLCAREAGKGFLRRGMVPGRSKAAGKIIFTSSVHEIIPWAGHANYATCKGGLMLLMKTIAQELAPMRDWSYTEGDAVAPVARLSHLAEPAMSRLSSEARPWTVTEVSSSSP
jgi:glucose 1-dehydrogenase